MALQYVLVVPEYVSLKSVPPTATLYGVDAKRVDTYAVSCIRLRCLSQPAAPLSPAETKTETPSATAC